MARLRIVGPATLALCGLLAAPLAAEPPPPVRAPAVQAVIDCRKIEDGTARLACFDAAVANLDQAEAKGDVVSIDRQQRQAVRRQAFGFSLPSLAVFDRGEKPEEVNKITDTVAAVSQTADGKWILQLQSGAVWRQTDDNELSRRPRPGSAVVIEKAALGSFMMFVDDQPEIRVHRDN
jgi:hypothetical protein